MERGFQSLLITGKAPSGDDNFSPMMNSDEAYMSFQPLNYDNAVFSSLHYPYGSSSSSSVNVPSQATYDILNGNFRNEKIGECLKEDGKWRCTEREGKMKKLKNEPSTEPCTFSPTIPFGQLPELRSLEQINHEKHLNQSHSPIANTTNPHMLESMLTNFQLTSNYFNPAPLQQIRTQLPFSPPAKLSHREVARRRRNTLSDKTRSLQKVLPWDKKMDMATIYEETYKYIKFLQAQIAVLESMPVASTSSSNFGSENPRYGNLYGGLGKLNRQQLLEILVNSPTAQTILYSKGCCIYSLEQLILFKDIAEKNFILSGPSIFS